LNDEVKKQFNIQYRIKWNKRKGLFLFTFKSSSKKTGKEQFYYKLFPLIACEEGCSSGLAKSGVVLGAPKDTPLRPLGTSPCQGEENIHSDFVEEQPCK